MKLTRDDWTRLRWPLVGLGVSIVLTTLLVSYMETQRVSTHQQLTQQQSILNQASQRYRTSGQEKETIIKYLPIYQQLITQGFIGEERRIEWVDSLRNIHHDKKLFSINYSIGAQTEYKPSFTINTGSLKLYRSIMKLDLAMLHEGDIINLIDALGVQQPAPFITRECEIKRLGSVDPNVLLPHFQANCELDWITMREPQLTGQVAP